MISLDLLTESCGEKCQENQEDHQAGSDQDYNQDSALGKSKFECGIKVASVCTKCSPNSEDLWVWL